MGSRSLLISGFLKLADGTQTRSGIITASMTHSPPETFDGVGATEQSDIYSLVSTLYELMAGRPPFEKADTESLPALVLRIMTEEPRDLVDFGPPKVVSELVKRGLEKSPDARFSSALELIEQIHATLSESKAPASDPDATRRGSGGLGASGALQVTPTDDTYVTGTVSKPRATFFPEEEPAAPKGPSRWARLRSLRPRWGGPVVVTLLMVGLLTWGVVAGDVIADASTSMERVQLKGSHPKAGSDVLAAAGAPFVPERHVTRERFKKLSARRGNNVVAGRLHSSEAVCSSRRRVNLSRLKGGHWSSFRRAQTDEKGLFTFKLSGSHGRFIVSSRPSIVEVSSLEATKCGAIKSQRVIVHAPAPVAPTSGASYSPPSTTPTTPGTTGPSSDGSLDDYLDDALD